MIPRPPRSTRTDTLFPYTTLFRSDSRFDIPEQARIIDGGPIWLFTARPDAAKADRLRERNVTVVDLPQTRSEEHTSELQSLMRISYAVFCLKQKKSIKTHDKNNTPKTQLTQSHTITQLSANH